MKNVELQQQLFEEFYSWFAPQYNEWKKKQFDKMGDDIDDLLSAFSHVDKYSDSEANSKVEAFDKKWQKARWEFLMKAQEDYYDVVFDQYNEKKIGKRALKVYGKELTESIEILRDKMAHAK